MSTKLDELEVLNRKADHYLRYLLEHVGTWHLYSQETMQHGQGIAMLGDKELIQFRTHFADMYPNGIQAYELSEKGLDTLEALAGQEAADEAVEQREFYRKETSREGWEARRAAENTKKLLENVP